MNSLHKISKLSILFRNIPLKSEVISISSFHTSCLDHAGQDWRRARGMPSNPNAYGPFSDAPDYTFVDGRPTPPGMGRIKRAVKQKEITKKIVQLTSEVDFAVSRHQRIQQEEENRKAEILSRKLKRKGQQPMPSTTTS